jgi:hypothetical protein
MDFPYGETVQVLTAGTTTDPYSGDPVSAWELDDGQTWTTEPSERDVERVAVGDGGTFEPVQDARNALEADYDLILPTGDPITRYDRVRVRGDICDVVGKPFLWHSPFTGWEPGIVVHVKFAEG